MGSISVKKQPLLGKIALLVLPCPSFLHILQNYILKGCAKTTGLLFYLRGHFIVADPKPVSRSQNERDFKSCSHPIVLRSIFRKRASLSLVYTVSTFSLPRESQSQMEIRQLGRKQISPMHKMEMAVRCRSRAISRVICRFYRTLRYNLASLYSCMY